jgi:hypothetical protein
MTARSQLGLFDSRTYAIDADFASLRRTQLTSGAWFDYGQGFLSGHEALLQELTQRVRFHEESRVMYERTVAVPRLVASLPADGVVPPVLELARQAISARYGEQFDRVSLATTAAARTVSLGMATISRASWNRRPSRPSRWARHAHFTCVPKAEVPA